MKEKVILLIKKFIYSNFNVFNYRGRKAIESVSEIFKKEEQVFENSKYTVGIVKEKWHLHSSFVKACQELNVSYKVLDFFSKDWLLHIKSKKVDFLIVRPSVQYTPWKDMFDNRLRLLQNNYEIPIFPNLNELWIWENKLRTLEFLKINKLPHPKSYIFYELDEIFDFSSKCNYPIVYKASSGSGSSGVKILHNYSQVKKIVKKVFNVGIRSYRKHKLDKEHGFLILQDYLPNVKEWRIIRIGDYYFGFEKIIIGEFHSGSQNFDYGMPPDNCLELAKEVTEKYNFKYVSIDIFLTSDGLYLINEIQPYFAQKDDRELLRINNKTGALFFDEFDRKWKFEKGKFCKNNLSNLRIKEIIKQLNK